MRKKIEVKDKRELAERLMLGEPIENGDGDKLAFDQTLKYGPFIRKSKDGYIRDLAESWDDLDDLYLEVPWQENIGKGKLCWVWNSPNKADKRIKIVVGFSTSSANNYRYETLRSWFENAEPMTPEEIAEYTVQLTV